MSSRCAGLVTVQRLDSYKLPDRTQEPSTHDSAGALCGAQNRPRPMPSPVDSSADVHLIVQGAT
jgi:hypothetical protein